MSTEERTVAGKKGYKNGISLMSEKERMAAGKKGYENGLGAMLAEEKTTASAKRMSKAAIKWEENYDEFKRCVGMPERGTPLFSWQMSQLGNGPNSLNAKILKEIEENKIEWSERREKFSDVVEKMALANIGIKWEEN
jgi:hypothetical protein